ncbi:hypothetical protein K9M79_02440 [Candidatus Woesearchaeota archaeon]|nr:hypothetical protein [Candidatus Woesearchaeota archaeon]
MNQEEDSSVRSEAQERQTAYVVSISEISSGDFVKGEGWNPNFVVCGNLKISRVNLMGVVISVDNGEDSTNGPMSLMLDDGTGSIEIRSFEPSVMFKRVNIGDLANIIGRIRQFDNNIFIFPEIISKIDNTKWLDYRKKQMEVLYDKPIVAEKPEQFDEPMVEDKSKSVTPSIPQKPSVINEEVIEDVTDSNNILDTIRKLDEGNGADIEDIKKATGMQDVDAQMNILKERGDIFEVRPGRVKVLE